MTPIEPRPPLTSPRPVRRRVESRLDAIECPRCGRAAAKVIGRSEIMPVVYLRCDGCRLTSVAGV